MRVELVTGTSNVVRFPIERRARLTLELLRDIAPDVREVLQLAESFDLPLPAPELRHEVDRDVAEHILNHVRPEPGPQRHAELEALLTPVLARAAQACREAHEASVAATTAQRRVVEAQTEGGSWLAPLEDRANALSTAAAQKLVDAYARAEEAEGTARAVGMALRGETWVPFDLQAEAEALFFGPSRRAG